MIEVHVTRDICEERERQEKKWGEQNRTPLGWLPILMEEVGEAAQAALQGQPDDFRREMVQVAALAVAIIECLDRGKWEVTKGVVFSAINRAHAAIVQLAAVIPGTSTPGVVLPNGSYTKDILDQLTRILRVMETLGWDKQ